jgi:FixJ family two-component response regulator
MISIIEDDVSVRKAVEALLQSAGMEYQSFGSSEEFLSGFSPDAENILVLDLNLPGISGYDLLKKIVLDKTDIQVIVTTAFDEPGSREFCINHGVKAYFRKPVDGEALIDIIKFYQHPLQTTPGIKS